MPPAFEKFHASPAFKREGFRALRALKTDRVAKLIYIS